METFALIAISEFLVTGKDLRSFVVGKRGLFGLDMPGIKMLISVSESELRVLFDLWIVSTALMVHRSVPSILLRVNFLLPHSQVIPRIL